MSINTMFSYQAFGRGADRGPLSDHWACLMVLGLFTQQAPLGTWRVHFIGD